MRIKGFLWYLAPGFSVIDAMRAFRDLGVEALNTYADEISVRYRKGWKRVRISLTVQREKAQ